MLQHAVAHIFIRSCPLRSVELARRYILVYPQGCDVCNHLSLFLCVADYEKLLPGWNHFAQFTIAVVNCDPKKSKYSGASAVLCCPLPYNRSARPALRWHGLYYEQRLT